MIGNIVESPETAKYHNSTDAQLHIQHRILTSFTLSIISRII